MAGGLCLLCKQTCRRGKGYWKPKIINALLIEDNPFILRYFQHKQQRFEPDVDRICRSCVQKAKRWNAMNEKEKADQKIDENEDHNKNINEDQDLDKDKNNDREENQDKEDMERDSSDYDDNLSVGAPENSIGLIRSKRLLHQLEIPGYTRVAVIRGTCIIAGCSNLDVHKIPLDIRLDVLLKKNIHIAQRTHICTNHDQANVWPNIQKLLGKVHKTFNSSQLAEMIDLLKRAGNRGMSFEEITTNEQMYQYYTGFNKIELLMILSKTPSLRWKLRKPLKSLSMVLTRLHRGDSLEGLCRLFFVSRRTLTNCMRTAKECLIKEFIPPDIGYDPKTMDLKEAVQRTLDRKMRFFL